MTDNTRLVHELSRELRAPLTVISGYLETLYDTHEEWQAPFDRMIKQSNRIDRLLNDLVYLTRLEEAENEAAQVAKVDIAAVIQMVTDEQRLYHPNKTFSYASSTQSDIQGNGDQLYTAFTKLLENAGENTAPDGCIEVLWHEVNGTRVLCIKDNGVGIEPQHLPRITDRFYRTDLNSDGVGLGLCIVKSILEHHSACLRISSEFGKGTAIECVFKLE
ncbi:MAG: ATP-binding protein [Pseudomonadota bacterium]